MQSNAAELRKQLIDIPQDQLDYSRTWSHEKTLEAITTAAKNRELCARWLEAFVREVGMVSSADTVATMILEALVEYEGVIPVARFHDEIMAMRNERGKSASEGLEYGECFSLHVGGGSMRLSVNRYLNSGRTELAHGACGQT